MPLEKEEVCNILILNIPDPIYKTKGQKYIYITSVKRQCLKKHNNLIAFLFSIREELKNLILSFVMTCKTTLSKGMNTVLMNL